MQRVFVFLFSLVFLHSCATQRSIRKPEPQKTVEDAGAKNETPAVEAALPQPRATRQVVDDSEASDLFQEGRLLWREGQKTEALAKINNYIKAYPQGQFADAAGLFMAEYWLQMNDPTKAMPYLEQIASLSPPSPRQDELSFFRAKAHYELGQYDESLAELSKVSVQTLPPKYRADFYKLWALASFDKAQFRNATLAYVKLSRESLAPLNTKKEARAKIEDIVKTKLSEAELESILTEYGSKGFPGNVIQLRLARIKLGQGDRFSAETYLSNVIAHEPSSSAYRAEATAMLQNLKFSGQNQGFRIGALFPLSGRYEQWGQQVRDGLELALSSSGLRQVPEVVYADAGPNVESAKAAFERLVSEDRVTLVLGPASGSQSEEIALLANRYAIPFISLSPRSGILEAGPYAFRFAVTAESQVRAIVKYAWEQLEARRFAILFPQDSFGESFAEPFIRVVRNRGGRITAAESYPTGTSDFQVVVRNMVGTAFPSFRKEERKEQLELLEEKTGREPTRREVSRLKLPPIIDFDVLFIPDTYKSVGQILPSLAFEEIKDVKLLGPSTWHSKRLLDRAGQFMEGATVLDVYSRDRPSDKVVTFEKEYRMKYGESPTQFSAIAYDLGLSLAKALKSSSESDLGREEVKIALENLGRVSGVIGLHQWDVNRDALGSLQVFRVGRSRFQYLSDISIH